MHKVHVPFIPPPHRWVATIYVVNVFDTVLFCIDTFVGLLPHILAWSYQMLTFGNTALVLCRDKIFQSIIHQLGRIP